MNSKTFLAILATVIVTAAGFLALYSYTTEKQGVSSVSEFATYFADRAYEEATAGGLIPIEGFDANLLMGAFPGLTEADFDEVETGASSKEGVYMYKNDTLVWQRTAGQPISSAEKTVTKVGYATLLRNLSVRLSQPINEQSDVDLLIQKLTDSRANGFEGCVGAGFAVMESYPRQCSDGTQTFTEFIGNELEKTDLIRLDTPRPNQEVESPLAVSGEARGYWFFEASFPVVLTDWDGRIIAQGIATAEGEWMTEDFVPFTAILTYASELDSYSNNGTLILKKDNPSGLPEKDDALEIPVLLGGFGKSEGGAGTFSSLSGVRGRVLLGPVCPVMKNPPEAGCDDRPLETSVRVFVTGSMGKPPLATTMTDGEGNFSFSLPPGSYTLQATGGQPLPRCEAKDITVLPGTMSEENLSCDTGIR